MATKSGAKFSILGLKDITDKLQEIPEEIAHKAVKSSLRKAAKLVYDAAYNNALAVDDPKTGRKIADNIRLQFASRLFQQTDGNLVMYRIGVSTSRGNIPTPNTDTGPRGSTPHWHLIEFGTQKNQSQPYMRPALDNNVSQVIDSFVINLGHELDKLSK